MPVSAAAKKKDVRSWQPKSFTDQDLDRRELRLDQGPSPGGGGGTGGHDDPLRCRVCKLRYSPDPEAGRLPRDLTCGHVVCESCVQSASSRTSAICPQCQRKTSLSGKKVQGLPVNRQLLLLLTGSPPGGGSDKTLPKSSTVGSSASSKKPSSAFVVSGDVIKPTQLQQHLSSSEREIKEAEKKADRRKSKDGGSTKETVYVQLPGSSQLLKTEVVREGGKGTATLLAPVPHGSTSRSGEGTKVSSREGTKERTREGTMERTSGITSERTKGETVRKSTTEAVIEATGTLKTSRSTLSRSEVKKSSTPLSTPSVLHQSEPLVAVVKENVRLHPPPQGAGGRAVESGGDADSFFGVEDMMNAVIPLEPQVVVQQPAEVVRSSAPKSFVGLANDDVITAHQVQGHAVDFGSMSSDWALLADLPQQQPTTATYTGSFGKYSEIRSSPGGFCRPTKIACSVEHKVVIVDTVNQTVQAFSPNGECLAIFAVSDVTGASFLSESLLAVSSGRGVELYGIDGRLMKSIPLGPTTAVCRYLEGFIAAHPTRLSLVPSHSGTALRRHTLNGHRAPPSGDSNPPTASPFHNITDAVAGLDKQICILDGSSIIIINSDGDRLATVTPGGSDVVAARGLFQPYALGVDPAGGHLVVSDSKNRHVSLFAMRDGSLLRCVVNLADQVQNGQIRPYGVAVNGARQLFIVLRAPGIAETAIYSM